MSILSTSLHARESLETNTHARIPAVDLRASVIIVTHNSRLYLERCLRSLTENIGEDVEIILVDSASTDGGPDYVESEFSWVRVVRSSTNLGFSGANNLGALLASGQYLVFLNPDTQVQPGWLEALIAVLDADPGAGLSTSRILLMNNPDKINTCGNDVHLTGLTLCRGMGMPQDAFPHLEEVGAVSGASFAISRELFEALGGFDEDFFMYMEDTDLSLRARLYGYHCLYVPDSIVYHDYTLRFTPLKTFYQERNRYLMLLKCLRWCTLLLLLPALLLAEMVTWGFVFTSDRNNLANKLRACSWIMKNWHQIMHKRDQVQASRRVTDRDLLAIAAYRLEYGQTGDSLVSNLASRVFDPLFRIWHQIALSLLSS